MFDAIAPRYDFLNHFLSLGIDRRWRRKAVERLQVPQEGRVLDMACGTGDVALEIARQYPHAAEILGIDISRGMLAVANRKIEAAGEKKRIRLLEGACEAIPAAAAAFDGAVIAFGIRNVPDRRQSLLELRRVLKPGAKLIVLELSQPSSRLFRPLFLFYFHHILPLIGGLFSRLSAYRYLPRSVAQFPPPPRFSEMLEEAGFYPVRYQALNWGMVSLYEATSTR
jgi:demethylmenaquinone methyltransferase/2-methoxy-6-polyprenyl-1,4-benzoquinol methylase